MVNPELVLHSAYEPSEFPQLPMFRAVIILVLTFRRFGSLASSDSALQYQLTGLYTFLASIPNVSYTLTDIGLYGICQRSLM